VRKCRNCSKEIPVWFSESKCCCGPLCQAAHSKRMRAVGQKTLDSQAKNLLVPDFVESEKENFINWEEKF